MIQGLHSGKLFLHHLFIGILFLFILGFLRFILFYIYYIREHFSSWIFYPYLLFSSLLIWFICSLYSTFCMYAHFPKFFFTFIRLLFVFIILLIYVDMCYYMYCILFPSFLYLCKFCLKFSIILFMLVLLSYISSCFNFFVILFILILLPDISLCLKFSVIFIYASLFASYFISCHIWVFIYLS